MELGDTKDQRAQLRRHSIRRAGAKSGFQCNSDIHSFNERSRFE